MPHAAVTVGHFIRILTPSSDLQGVAGGVKNYPLPCLTSPLLPESSTPNQHPHNNMHAPNLQGVAGGVKNYHLPCLTSPLLPETSTPNQHPHTHTIAPHFLSTLTLAPFS